MRKSTAPARAVSRRAVIGVGAIAALAAHRPGVAHAAPQQDPQAVVFYVAAEGLAAANPRLPSEQRFQRLQELFSRYFDVGHIAAFALGRYRRLATPAQLQQYDDLYVTFTIEIYGGQLAQYADLPVRVVGSRMSDGAPLVTTEITRSDGRPVKIEWSLVDRHGRWKVSDVNIAGLSMRDSQRQYFAQWIETNGGRFDALLAVMRQQIAAARQGAT